MNSLKQFMPDAYKRVARMVAYALTIGEDTHWVSLLDVLRVRLEPKERGAIAWAMLQSLESEQAAAVARSVLPSNCRMPLPPLLNCKEEAALWAEVATPGEIEVYCWAAFQRMNPKRQSAFLNHVERRAVA